MTMAMQYGTASSNRGAQMRRAVIKGARIIFNDRNSTLDCRLRDLTRDSARLDLSIRQLPPREFDRHLSGNPVRRCGLRWASGTAVGLRFFARPEGRAP